MWGSFYPIVAKPRVALTNILLTSAEAAPFAKVGGMADVVGSLPGALRRMGIDARVILPGYGFINHTRYNIEHLFSFPFTHRLGTSEVNVYTTLYDEVPFYFVQAWPYFGPETSVYTDWEWDVPRFIFYNQVLMAVAWELGQRAGWFPDVFHVNDWHTGLVPFLLEASRHEQGWRKTATLLTIHNLAYQGDHAGGFLYMAGVYGRNHPQLVARGLTDNMMGIAIAYSDIVTTVSPRYAIEIQYPSMGYGLDGLIHNRVNDLYGILNGIDTQTWDPALDPRIAANFDAENFEAARPANKVALQDRMGLPAKADTLLIGLVSRMVQQKGIDLLAPAMRRLMAGHEVQFVALGTGEPDLEHEMWRLGKDFGWRGARVYLGYDNQIAQSIYAGCDLFVMPSHFEPCGMGQMLAMRYGALPLVRETGGLADTVENYDNGDAERGTGFTFLWEEVDALHNTLVWALNTYRHRPDAWKRMQARAMRTNFSWTRSAAQYSELYEKAILKRKGT